MESLLNVLSVDTFLSRYMTNRVGRLVRKYGNKYTFFQCKNSEIRGGSGPKYRPKRMRRSHLKNVHLKAYFHMVYFKSGPRVKSST